MAHHLVDRPVHDSSPNTHTHPPTTQHIITPKLDAAADHDAGRSGAARAVPYASRLVLEAWAHRDHASGSVGRIRLAYNDRAIATLDGGLREWRARYAAALAVR